MEENKNSGKYYREKNDKPTYCYYPDKLASSQDRRHRKRKDN
jgi:hypothetical protein